MGQLPCKEGLERMGPPGKRRESTWNVNLSGRSTPTRLSLTGAVPMDAGTLSPAIEVLLRGSGKEQGGRGGQVGDHPDVENSGR